MIAQYFLLLSALCFPVYCHKRLVDQLSHKHTQCPQCPTCQDTDMAATKPNQESFFTAEPSTNQTIAHNGHFNFDVVLTDPGEDFVPLLGVFECSDDSWYVFYWIVHAAEGRMSAALVRQGQDVKLGPVTAQYATHHSGSSSMSSLARCSPGIKFWVRAVGWPDDRSCNIAEGVYTSFSGFKLERDDADLVGFTTQLSNNETVGDTEIIKFDDVLVDLDSNYDPEIGRFQCPLDGVYVFAMSAHINGSTRALYYRIYKNGQNQFYGGRRNTISIGSEDTGTASINRMIECQQGDNVTFVAIRDGEFMASATSVTGYMISTSQENTTAFHAYFSGNPEYANGITIVFDQSNVNIGEHYKANFGIFVCPDSNYYFFSWSIGAHSENDARAAEVYLMMADGDVTEIKAGPKTTQVTTGSVSKSSSSQAVVRCTTNAAIYLRAVIPEGGLMTYHSGYSNFMGFQISYTNEDE